MMIKDIKKILEQEKILGSVNNNAFLIPSKRNIKLVVTLKNRVHFEEGLKLWLNTTVKKLLLRKFFLFLFDSRLIYLFYKNLISIDYNNEIINKLIPFDKIESFNIYVGLSKNNNACFTFQLITIKKNIYYSRLPINKESNKSALNEFRNIQYLNSKNNKDFNINTPLSYTPSFNYFFYTYMKVNGNLSKYDLNLKIIQILRVLQSNTFVSFNTLVEEVEEVEIYTILSKKEFLKKDKLKRIFDKTLCYLKRIRFKKTFFHGDFVFWNIMENKGFYSLFDFEYSKQKYLPLFDLCHYIYLGKGFYLKEMSESQMIYLFEKINKFSNSEKSVLVEKSENKLVVLNLIILFLFSILKRFFLIEGHFFEGDRIRYTLQNIYLAENLLEKEKQLIKRLK